MNDTEKHLRIVLRHLENLGKCIRNSDLNRAKKSNQEAQRIVKQLIGDISTKN